MNGVDYPVVAMSGDSPLLDPGVIAALSFAVVFGLAGVARWRGWDRRVAVLRAIADLVPGFSPFLVAAAALVAIPVEIALRQMTAGEPPNPLAAAAFLLILAVAVAVRLLTRIGASPRRLEAPIVGALLILLMILILVASPVVRASVFGIAFGSAALLLGGAIAYLYARGLRTPR
jgi:hypothetical protein